MVSLETLRFINSFARLPQSLYYSRVAPTPLPSPYLVSFNSAAAALLDLDPAEARRPDFTEYFCGNRILPGAEPLAMLYAGHQFGHFVQQLGDGRAILLGEVARANAEAAEVSESWEVQLKGAGQTPYSRDGDGRAVLRSSIREYLCSEAMHALGIPTTRALCIVGSDEEVYRETVETAAVVTRLAPSHLRFGSFEVFFARGQHEALAMLADYVIAKYFPEFANAADKYAQFFAAVVARTADMLAHWQAVGFSHGVMNTDNMSILGLTFDYGPFGFMETYDPQFVCNHSDYRGRYAYDQQPQISLWNLSRLAFALSPLVPPEETQPILERFVGLFARRYVALMRAKLGFAMEDKDDAEIITTWLDLLQANRMDYTNALRLLATFKTADGADNAQLRDRFIDRAAFDAWAGQYRARLHAEQSIDAVRAAAMNRVNPKYVLRNHLAQQAIERAQQRDYSAVDRLLELLSRPFDEQPGMGAYAEPSPEGAPHLAVSCSS